MKHPSSATILCEFCAGLALVIGSGIFSWAATAQIVDAHAWVTHTFEVLTVLGRLDQQTREAEIVQKLPASDARQTAFSHFAQQSMVEDKDILWRLTSDNPNQQDRLREITKLLSDGSPKALVEVRVITGDMHDEEQTLLGRRMARVSGEYKLALWLLLSGKIIGLAFLALSFIQHRQEIARRKLAEATLQSAYNELEQRVKRAERLAKS